MGDAGRRVVLTVAMLAVLSVSGVAFAKPLPPLRPHPRLFADETTFASLGERLRSDELVRRGAEGLKRRCDCDYLTCDLPKYGILDGRRMTKTSWYVTERVQALAVTYKLYGGERYLRKAEEIMVAAAEMPDWNPSHFLDVAVMAFGVATGYDWLYSDLMPEARERIRVGLERNGVEAGIRRDTLLDGNSNWAQVCPGGVTVAALAIAESATEKCEKLVRRVVAGMPEVMKMYRPNGSYPEGPGYWTFGTGFNVILIAALESAYGTDFGLASQPGFKETGHYLDLVTGPSGFMFNYADCSCDRDPAWSVWWFARRFSDPGLVEPFEREAYLRNADNLNSAMLLLYVFPRDGEPEVNLPLAWRSEGRTDIAVQRSSWAKDGRFAALKGGKAVNRHGHMDGGSFVYDAKGVRWAWDMGSDDYAEVEHHIGMALWNYSEGSARYKVFRLSTAAHNTLMLDGKPHRAEGDVRVVSLSSGPESEVTLDLTPLFPGVRQVLRRGKMTATGYRLTDSILGLREGAPIRWQMMTKAKVRTEGDDLVLEAAGQVLHLRRQAPEGASAWIVDEAPHGAEWEKRNEEYRRISFMVPSDPVGTLISVEFE